MELIPGSDFDHAPNEGIRHPLPGNVAPASPPRGRTRLTTASRLLWIDDDLRPADAQVRFLEFEGLAVDYALTAAAGLARARSRRYDLILLDHRLPDGFGTDLLPDLTPADSPVPVVLLTGFGDIDGGIAAIRAGAAEYKTKPIDIDVLVGLIRDVLERPRPRPAPAISAADAGTGTEIEWLETVGTRLGTCISKQELTGVILRTLLDRRLTLRWFPGCAAALRYALTTKESSRTLILLELRRVIATAAGTRLPRHPKVIAALAELEAGGIKQSQEILAKHTGLSRAYFSHRISAETGRNGSEWCRAALMRSAVRQVLGTSDQLSQIAYSLRYDHAGQFSHDFGLWFGAPPRELRRLDSELLQSGP
jgi:DNA-binding response OmpR family regulator